VPRRGSARRFPPPPRTLPRPLPTLAVLALMLALALGAPSQAGAARGPHDDGDRVRLTGLVTDATGRPIAGLQVVFEAARAGFSVRTFRRERKEIQRLTGLTNERGEYDLEWPWNSYYNDFELMVGIPVRDAQGERLRELERVDLNRKIEQGSPVVSALVVQESEFVYSLRDFLASIRSAEERRTHQEMGEPDKVEQLQFPSHSEVAWWYFEAGKVYRFRDGKLERIEQFDPVRDEL
jgi:hypothetical protein